MGVYIYCAHPAHVARAVIDIGGVEHEIDVALYRYAYKPSHNLFDGRARNARWRFNSGAAAAAAAWGTREVPRWGASFSRDDKSVQDAGGPGNGGLFLTKGDPEVYDDYVDYPKDVKLVRWLKLPKGFKTYAPRREIAAPLQV